MEATQQGRLPALDLRLTVRPLLLPVQSVTGAGEGNEALVLGKHLGEVEVRMSGLVCGGQDVRSGMWRSGCQAWS